MYLPYIPNQVRVYTLFAYLNDVPEGAPISRLYLAYISPVSRLYLPISPLYLAYISPISRHISPISPPHLPGGGTRFTKLPADSNCTSIVTGITDPYN